MAEPAARAHLSDPEAHTPATFPLCRGLLTIGQNSSVGALSNQHCPGKAAGACVGVTDRTEEPQEGVPVGAQQKGI